LLARRADFQFLFYSSFLLFFKDSAATMDSWTLDSNADSNYNKNQKEILKKYIKPFASNMLEW
jgi:hypothetical protein